MPFDANSGVAGFVSPQSHVDVLSMVGSGQETKVAPILSDVEVVAVGQQFEREAKGQATPASSVTVAVSPEDTNKLIKAVAASKLYLSLRNDKDHMPVTTVDVTALFAAPKRIAQDPLGMAVTALEPPLYRTPCRWRTSSFRPVLSLLPYPCPRLFTRLKCGREAVKDVIQVTQK
ncbi:MAG: Flp pilus assembly protein CpaB [Candidatus Competibacteraceae bacterium]|nr:Flp pilus assembly protein CpaB [Candidatus Competibacteraceae bacterium]